MRETVCPVQFNVLPLLSSDYIAPTPPKCLNSLHFSLTQLFGPPGFLSGPDFAQSVHESNALTTLGLAFERKQFPRFVGNVS